ncbi:MAG: hypothetical protein ACF8MF_13190 [Phycisphaerales bacterium JB052]
MTSFDVFDDAVAASRPCPHQRRLTRLIAVLCSVAGLILAAHAANPSVLGSLSTLELFGIVVLSVFPLLTLLLLRYEHQTVKSAEWGKQYGCTQTRSTTHDAHERPLRVHARLLGETSGEAVLHEQVC